MLTGQVRGESWGCHWGTGEGREGDRALLGRVPVQHMSPGSVWPVWGSVADRRSGAQVVVGGVKRPGRDLVG